MTKRQKGRKQSNTIRASFFFVMVEPAFEALLHSELPKKALEHLTLSPHRFTSHATHTTLEAAIAKTVRNTDSLPDISKDAI